MTEIRPAAARLAGVTRPAPTAPVKTRVAVSHPRIALVFFALALILVILGVALPAPALYVLAGFTGFFGVIVAIPGRVTTVDNTTYFSREFEPGTYEYNRRLERFGWR